MFGGGHIFAMNRARSQDRQRFGHSFKSSTTFSDTGSIYIINIYIKSSKTAYFPRQVDTACRRQSRDAGPSSVHSSGHAIPAGGSLSRRDCGCRPNRLICGGSFGYPPILAIFTPVWRSFTTRYSRLPTRYRRPWPGRPACLHDECKFGLELEQCRSIQLVSEQYPSDREMIDHSPLH